MKPARVLGTGLWTPGFANAADWIAGRRDAAVVDPPAAVLPPRLARRTSLLARMAAEAAGQACPAALLHSVPTVYGSAYGESETLVALLGMLQRDGELSPTRFHGSVHNAAGGCISIAADNRSFSTAVAAGPDTVGAALLEATALLHERGGCVLVVLCDEAPGAPFDRAGLSPFAASFLLGDSAADGPALALLSGLRRGGPEARAELPPHLSTNPAAPALRLAEAALAGKAATVPLCLDDGGGWIADLAPAGAAA